MKIFFTYSRGDLESSVQTHYNIAKETFPTAELIFGKKTILETYRHLSFLADNEFIWIDSDNIVYPVAKEILNIAGPCILMTSNEYGIVYGHGGIKRCNSHVPLRNNIIDVTYYLGLTPINIIGSFHTLGDGWIKDRAIFAEMIKCALRNDLFILEKWKSINPNMWDCADRLLKTSDIDTIINLIRNREQFRLYHENSLCGNLQERRT